MIQMRGVSCRYPEGDAEAVEDINLHIRPGECVVLAGGSGCGKSTLLKLMNGLVPHLQEAEVAGNITIAARPLAGLKSWELAQLVGTVNQNPRSQFFTTNTTTELAFAMENLGWPRQKIRDRLDSLGKAAGITHLMGRPVGQLSSGERQRVSIACALALRPKVLLFDEPSANLDYAATLALGRLLAELKAQGYTLIIAEHRLFYLRAVRDRMLYLQNGRLERVVPQNELDGFAPGDLRSLDPFSLPFAGAPLHAGSEMLCAENLGYKGVLSGVSLRVARGEVLALVGKNGAGKTTLAKLAAGILKPGAGSVRAKEAALVMQDADYQLFTASVAQELRLGAENPAEAEIHGMVQGMGLCGLEHRHPITLSGGQKQRVLLGAAGLCGAGLVMLDEPTSGLDAQNMRRVAALLGEMRKAAGVIVITHDYELIAAACTRLAWLDGGAIKADFPLQKGAEKQVRAIFEQLEDTEI